MGYFSRTAMALSAEKFGRACNQMPSKHPIHCQHLQLRPERDSKHLTICMTARKWKIWTWLKGCTVSFFSVIRNEEILLFLQSGLKMWLNKCTKECHLVLHRYFIEFVKGYGADDIRMSWSSTLVQLHHCVPGIGFDGLVLTVCIWTKEHIMNNVRHDRLLHSYCISMIRHHPAVCNLLACGLYNVDCRNQT